MTTKLLTTHRGYQIRQSGKSMVRICGLGEGNREMFGRYRSIEAAQGVIDANLERRPMTTKEYALVYGENNPYNHAEIHNRPDPRNRPSTEIIPISRFQSASGWIVGSEIKIARHQPGNPFDRYERTYDFKQISHASRVRLLNILNSSNYAREISIDVLTEERKLVVYWHKVS